MKLRKNAFRIGVFVVALAAPAWAQVEKVAMRTTEISCGVCAAVSEISFRRMPGVDEVAISKSKESIVLSYKPGARFQPAEIRKVLEPLKVGIAEFQVSARGRVQDQAGKRFFMANKDRFLLVPSAANAPKIPLDTPVVIQGVLNDKLNPMELKILAFKPIAK